MTPSHKPKIFTIPIRTKVTLNDNTGWRRWIGNQLRTVANKIDRRDSLAFEIHSDAVLSRRQHQECIRQAFKALEKAVAAECDAEAAEVALRAHKPQLFPAAKKADAA